MWFWSNIVYIAPALGSCVSVRHAELTTVAEMWQWLIGEQLALVYHYHKGYLNCDTILTGFHYMVHNQYFTQELFVSLFFVGYFNLFFFKPAEINIFLPVVYFSVFRSHSLTNIFDSINKKPKNYVFIYRGAHIYACIYNKNFPVLWIIFQSYHSIIDVIQELKCTASAKIQNLNALPLLPECSFGAKLLISCLDVYKSGSVEWIWAYYIILRYAPCHSKPPINDKTKIFLDDVCCGIDCGPVWLRISLSISFLSVKLWFLNIRPIYARASARNSLWSPHWLYTEMTNYFACCLWIAKYHFKAMHVISFGFCIIYSQNVVKKGLFCMCVH